jgi:hypothetical protein
MPNPKDHIDDDYTFVKAHVRAKYSSSSPAPSLPRKPMSATTKVVLKVVLVVFLISSAIASKSPVWIFIAGIIVLIIAIPYWQKHDRLQHGQYYTAPHHCPNCGNKNQFKYPQGFAMGTTTQRCWHCHVKFTR